METKVIFLLGGSLWHELGHVYNAITNPYFADYYGEDKNKFDKGSSYYKWTDFGEMFNIINNENPLALEKGLLARNSHSPDKGDYQPELINNSRSSLMKDYLENVKKGHFYILEFPLNIKDKPMIMGSEWGPKEREMKSVRVVLPRF